MGSHPSLPGPGRSGGAGRDRHPGGLELERPPNRRFLLAGLVVALVLAGIVSFYASSQPDGLERVAIDLGFADMADGHVLADGPLGDYGLEAVDDARLSGGLAGIIGVGVTLAVGWLAFRLLSRPGGGDDAGAPGPAGREPPASGEADQRPEATRGGESDQRPETDPEREPAARGPEG